MSAAFPSNVSRYNPGRPSTSRDVEISLNGRMTLLGVIVSTGAAADNSSAASVTATGLVGGFFKTADGGNLVGTLAGRVLLLEPTAAGSVLAATAPLGTSGQVTVTGLSLPTATTQPGPKLQAEERIPFIMGAQDGWLQWLPAAGSANLFVWSLT